MLAPLCPIPIRIFSRFVFQRPGFNKEKRSCCPRGEAARRGRRLRNLSFSNLSKGKNRDSFWDYETMKSFRRCNSRRDETSAAPGRRDHLVNRSRCRVKNPGVLLLAEPVNPSTNLEPRFRISSFSIKLSYRCATTFQSGMF